GVPPSHRRDVAHRPGRADARRLGRHGRAVHALRRPPPPDRLRRPDAPHLAPPHLPPLHRPRPVRHQPDARRRCRRPPRHRGGRARAGHRPMSRSVTDRRADAARFDFRRLHACLRFGTASDRYAGWIDQVYPRDVWAGEVTTRSKRVGRASFEERMLPVASVEDYFLHFGVLELDFPFYRPFVEADGKPSNTLFTLRQYAEHAPANARFLLKAPQAFTARTLRQRADGKTQHVPNPDYLDAKAYTDRFLVPAMDALGP